MNYKIGIDIQPIIGKKSGLGIYTQHLVEALVGEPPLRNQYTKPPFDYHLFSDASKEELNTLQRLAWTNIHLSSHVLKYKLDLLHVPAFAAPAVKFSKLVVTVHDLIGLKFPNQIGTLSKFYWGKWLAFTSKKADHIIADSVSTKNDIMEMLHYPESKITVIYPSGHEQFSAALNEKALQPVQTRCAISKPYFMFVGTIEPRKNLNRVIEAFNRFLKKHSSTGDFQLVIVGAKNFGHGQVFQDMVAEHKIKDNSIIFTDYIGHAELNALYCGSRGLLFPSLYEGFGIPIVEAMACRIPVLTANASSTREVAGEAALLVNPESISEIEKGIEVLAFNEDLRTELIAKGTKQLKKFSWGFAADQTRAVYQKVLES